MELRRGSDESANFAEKPKRRCRGSALGQADVLGFARQIRGHSHIRGTSTMSFI